MSVTTEPMPPATYADLEALPENVRGEIIDGVLYTQPQPRPRHMIVATRMAGDIEPAFDRGKGGPGGWWIILQPGIEHPRAPEVSPDLAGWRRETMPHLHLDEAPNIVPDWVCEILSPSNRRYDLTIKKPFYASIGVRWLWIVDPPARMINAFRLLNGRWDEVGVYFDNDKARIEPFDAVELDLSPWWPEE